MHDFDWVNTVVFPFCNFLLFLFILIYFAKKPLNAFLNKQKSDFEELKKRTEEAFVLAHSEWESLNKRLSQLSTELEDLRKRSVEESEHEIKKLEQKAEATITYIKQEADRLCEQEVYGAQKAFEKNLIERAQQQIIEQLSAGAFALEKEKYTENRMAQLTKLKLR